MGEDFVITINDVRKTGHCVAGIRTWFKFNNLDFKDFLANGISAHRVLEVGDDLGAGIVKKIQEKRDGCGR